MFCYVILRVIFFLSFFNIVKVYIMILMKSFEMLPLVTLRGIGVVMILYDCLYVYYYCLYCLDYFYSVSCFTRSLCNYPINDVLFYADKVLMLSIATVLLNFLLLNMTKLMILLKSSVVNVALFLGAGFYYSHMIQL